MRSKAPPPSFGLPATGMPPEDLRLVKTVFHRGVAGHAPQASSPVQPRVADKSSQARLLAAWRTASKKQVLRAGVATSAETPHESAPVSGEAVVAAMAQEVAQQKKPVPADADLSELERLLPSNQYANLLSGLHPEHIDAIKQVAREADAVIVFSRQHTHSNFWRHDSQAADRNAGGIHADFGAATDGHALAEKSAPGLVAATQENRQTPHSPADEMIFGRVIGSINERVKRLAPAGQRLVQYAEVAASADKSPDASQSFFVFPDGKTLMSTSPQETAAVEQAVQRANYLASGGRL